MLSHNINSSHRHARTTHSNPISNAQTNQPATRTKQKPKHKRTGKSPVQIKPNYPPSHSQNGAAAYGKPTPTKLKRDKPRQSRALELTSPTRSLRRRMRHPPMMRMKSVVRIRRRLTGSVGCISARLCLRSS